MANIKVNGGGDDILGVDPADASGGFLTWHGNWGGLTVNTGQITCASAVAATLIVAANPARLQVTLYNNQNGNTWIANTSASTTASSTGWLLAGKSPQTFRTQAAIYGLASSGTTAITSYIEEAL